MKNLILINLNQTVNRELLSEQKKERTRWIIFGFILIVMIGISYGYYYISQNLSTLVNLRENRIEDVIDQSNALKKEGINLSKKDIESLHKIETNRILWAEKLKIIANITPEHMAITELEFRNNRLIITAISRVYSDKKDFDVVNELINLLTNNELFSRDFPEIQFKSSDRRTTREQEYLLFQVEAKQENNNRRK
ncbi:MAG: PilN domain-containing protein [Candidatus Marinimicrobia bacterium]|nr:PilN domain-containing protein [Candidatus Neomarinimicrobiota bacterium]MBL7022879.1 PilN domain-containing protein [Candidatus Neomarinimicrobiota bacterium]MBL7109198.1 PilN domain-containing protein [Candidatus Neomarinimicrobiota bacterium]